MFCLYPTPLPPAGPLRIHLLLMLMLCSAEWEVRSQRRGGARPTLTFIPPLSTLRCRMFPPFQVWCYFTPWTTDSRVWMSHKGISTNTSFFVNGDRTYHTHANTDQALIWQEDISRKCFLPSTIFAAHSHALLLPTSQSLFDVLT